MATNSSPIQGEFKELFRHGEGDGEEDDDGDEMLDPRVKGELDRLNSSTAEINRLEQDLEELQAAFRQTLTESAFVLKRQASFFGKSCVDSARPYYDAMRRAKQAQIETQKAALKYEKAGTAHKAAKDLLATAEQKLVSTSKEHKILDPKLQEMLNQAVLRVTEAERERALSEREHLETARVFSAAGSKVTELRTKLKSVINKSRPYFELKMKYDQILEAHKRQVENIQEGLQVAKQEYSLALRNLEGISEEIHEMRRSRDSLDTILREREEGVGAESPSADESYESTRSESGMQNPATSSEWLDKPTYGFKIALVYASGNDNVATRAVQVESENGTPVAEREGDPEGYNSLDTEQLCMDSRPTELDGISRTSSGPGDNCPSDDPSDDTGGNSTTSVHGDGCINELDDEVSTIYNADICLSDNPKSSPQRGCFSTSDANSSTTTAFQGNTPVEDEGEVDDNGENKPKDDALKPGCPVEATVIERSESSCCVQDDVSEITSQQHDEGSMIKLDLIGCPVDRELTSNERTCCIQEDENQINREQHDEKPTVNLDVKDCPAETVENKSSESTCCIQDDESTIQTGEHNEEPTVSLESNCLPDARHEFSAEKIDKGISGSSVTDSDIRNQTDVSVYVLNIENEDSTDNKEETQNNQTTGKEGID